MAVTKSYTETLHVSTTGATFYLKAELKENSIDITNNTSNMTIKATLSAKSGGSSFSGTGGVLYVDWYDDNAGSFSNKNSETITSLSSGYSSSTSSTFNVTHKSDGTLKGRVRVRWRNSGTSYAPSDATIYTDYANLTTIPRQSKITAARYDNQITDHIVLLDITRYSNSYTDTISWSMSKGGTTLSETIQKKGTLTKIALCFDDSNTALPNGYTKIRSQYSNTDLMNLLGNDKECAITYNIQTFSGITSIGTNTASGVYKIVRSPYDLTASAVVTDSLTTNLTGNTDTIIKGISNVEVTITATKRQYYNDNSTITKYLFDDGTGSIEEEINNSHPFNQVSVKNFPTNIVDSRNLNSSVAIASITTLLDYFKPGISSLTTARAESTSSVINFTLSGTFWNDDFAVGTTNTISLKYRYKINNGSWATYTTISSGITINNNNFNYSGNFNPGSGTDSSDITIEVVVTDSTGSEFSLEATEPKGSSLFDIGENYFNINTRFAINHTIVMDAIQAVENKVNSLFFVANEQYTYNRVVAGGCITGSKQSILFAIPLPKNANGLKATILSGKIYARGIGGYLLNGTSITAASTITIYTESSFLSIGLTYPAFSSATNNTPVNIVLDDLKIKMTTP